MVGDRARAGLLALGPLGAGVVLLVAVAVAAAVALGIVFLLRGLERIDRAADAGTLVRGVRLLFLAVGAAAAALGWLGAVPVAIVAAFIIAAVDVIETSFLVLVTARHPSERHEGA